MVLLALGLIASIGAVVTLLGLAKVTPTPKPAPKLDPLRDNGPLKGFKLPSEVREGDDGGVHAEGESVYKKAEELPHGLFMHGRILDSMGRPLSGVKVHASGSLWMTTTRETKFVQESLFDFDYILSFPRKRGDFYFSKEGYYTRYFRLDPPLLTSGIDLQQSEMWRGSQVRSLKSGEVLHIERDIVLYPRPSARDVRVARRTLLRLNLLASMDDANPGQLGSIYLNGIAWFSTERKLKNFSVETVNDPAAAANSWPTSGYPVIYIRRVRDQGRPASGAIPSFDGDTIVGSRLRYQYPANYRYELVMQSGDEGDGLLFWKLLRGVDNDVPFSDSFTTTAPAAGYVLEVPFAAEVLERNYDGLVFEEGTNSFQWPPTWFLYFRLKGEYGVLAVSSMSGNFEESTSHMSINASVNVYYGGEGREINASN